MVVRSVEALDDRQQREFFDSGAPEWYLRNCPCRGLGCYCGASAACCRYASHAGIKTGCGFAQGLAVRWECGEGLYEACELAMDVGFGDGWAHGGERGREVGG